MIVAFTACPIECHCTTNLDGLLTIDCHEKQLHEVPSALPGGVAVLDLSHNKLGIIRDADLADCSNLTTLDMSFNQINTIEQLAFSDLRHLNELVLSNNQLIYGNRSSLPADLFHNVKLLKYIKIENNFARNQKNLVKTDEILKTLPISLTSIHAQFP